MNWLSMAFCLAALIGADVRADDEVDLLEQKAFQVAVKRAAPSLVQIETIGGVARVAGELEGSASTTGLVVSKDGEILTSAFAFAAKPSSILVLLADGRRLPAKKIATDHVTQLTLLKVEADDLPLPVAVRTEQIGVGQWGIAVGRTLDPKTPSVSVGIISALNRVWGKAIQTDAKVSPVNYGGALLDIQGRVQGVLVPLSPRSADLLAGVEWYDSGIGFAIPMETALASVERLRPGKDLKKGLIGVTFTSGNAIYGQKPELDLLRYDSPAEKAGMKKDDVIVGVDGKQIDRIAQVRHALGNKYAGDSIEIDVDRDGETKSFKVDLVAELPPWEAGFLGILPKRKSEKDASGVAVRFVIPDSPAAAMGLAANTIITKVDGEPVTDRDELASLIGRTRPGTAIELTFSSGDEVKTASGKLATLPEEAVVSLPNVELAEPDKKPEVAVGRFTETFETHQHDFWGYVPEKYSLDETYGLLVWLHPGGDTMEARILELWQEVCDSRGLILVAPKAAKVQGWNPNEVAFVKDTIELMQQRYSIDPRRVVVHGYGTSSPLSFTLAFKQRELVRGAIVVGGGLRSRPPENRPEFPLQFYLFGGERDPRFSRVSATAKGLRGMKYPVNFAKSPASGPEYPTRDAVRTFGRWIDSLDRI